MIGLSSLQAGIQTEYKRLIYRSSFGYLLEAGPWLPSLRSYFPHWSVLSLPLQRSVVLPIRQIVEQLYSFPSSCWSSLHSSFKNFLLYTYISFKKFLYPSWSGSPPKSKHLVFGPVLCVQKIHQSLFRTFWVIQWTERQTNRQTDKHIYPKTFFFGGGNNIMLFCCTKALLPPG